MSEEKNLCTDKCRALCCTGISIPVDKPTTRKGVEELRFYIVHRNIKIYIRSHRWYVLVNEECRNLGPDNLCSDYKKRPDICRTFSNEECEYWGDFFDTLFESEKELLAYLEERGIPRGKKKGVKKITLKRIRS